MSAMSDILERVPVVPVLTIGPLDDAVALARTLVNAGLPVIEVTLRTEAAPAAIKSIRQAVPDCLVGAGSVLDGDRLALALAAGAAFAVSPGTTPALLQAVEDCGLPFLPGAATVSEVLALRDRGYRVPKLYPALAPGRTRYLAAIQGPVPDVRFCPTGGIDAANAAGFLALANVAAVGGSWVAPPDAVEAREWDKIARLARHAASLSRG